MELEGLFHLVCRSGHLWAPGGQALPFCQRCTGLYVGGFLAVLVYLWFRPRPTTRTLWLHAGFLVLMAPFGYHWLPQNGVARTATGFLFACGLVYFLFLTPFERAGVWRAPQRFASGRAGACLAALLVLLLLAVRWGGALVAAILPWVGLAGFSLLLLLVLVSLVLVPSSLLRASR